MIADVMGIHVGGCVVDVCALRIHAHTYKMLALPLFCSSQFFTHFCCLSFLPLLVCIREVYLTALIESFTCEIKAAGYVEME